MALAYVYANRDEYKKLINDESRPGQEPTEDGPVALDICSEGGTLRRITEVLSRGDGGRLDIVHRGRQASGERDEVVFSVVGYVTQAGLPPIRETLKAFSKPVTASQWLELTGLGETTFDKAGSAIALIRNLLCDEAPANSIAAWNPRRDNEGFLRLKFSNRYLSTKDDFNEDVEEVSGDDLTNIDPKGILATFSMYGKHRKDNEVLYFERKKSTDGNRTSYHRTKPGSIRIGHLVEVQVSISAIRSSRKSSTFNMIQKLRSICILDRRAEDAQTLAHLTQRSQSGGTHSGPSREVAIRRRVGYRTSSSDEEDSLSGLKRMRLEGESEMDEEI